MDSGNRRCKENAGNDFVESPPARIKERNSDPFEFSFNSLVIFEEQALSNNWPNECNAVVTDNNNHLNFDNVPINPYCYSHKDCCSPVSNVLNNVII